MVSLAWMNFMVGVSLDQAIAIQEFYTTLKLSKSQVDRLLNRLMTAWLPEFDNLCLLLAVSGVVHADGLLPKNWSICYESFHGP